MEFQGQKAIFLQIADMLQEGILNGKWPPGERIPSVRDFASSVEVNPNTVMRAYTYLQEQDIVANKRGIGFFVSEEALQNIIKIKRKEFVEIEVPRISKMMRLLNISIDELEKYFSGTE